MKTIHAFSVLCFMLPMLLVTRSADAQINSRQNPPGLDWKVIETPHFEVIFPKAIEKDGQRVANTLEHVYPHVWKTLQHEPDRVSVILQANLAESNGFSNPRPRRIEFFNVPPQGAFLGPSDWYSMLSVHEFRHLSQFDKLNHGFTRFLYYLTGSTAHSMSFFCTPGWFFEGDAVCTETALSTGGRGRDPDFDAELRALLLSGKRYPYYKAMFGSYKDWDPLASPYLLGYYLTAHVRRHYGPDVWSNILDRTTNLSIQPQRFSQKMNAEIDRGAVTNYEETMDEIDSLFRKQVAGLKFTDVALLQNVDAAAWTYNYDPQYMGDGKVVVLREGLEDIPHFVLIDPVTHAEEGLYTPGQLNSGMFSSAGSKIAWTETEYDPRWGARTYSVVKVYDHTSRKVRAVTHNSRLFAPALSPDAGQITAVDCTTDNKFFIVVLDAETGAELKRFPNPTDEFLQTPHWSPDGRSIVFAKKHPVKGITISIINTETGEEDEIVPYTTLNIGKPVTDGVFVYFASPYSGIGNIYAVEISTKKTYQATSRKVGANSPHLSPHGEKLAFNDVTSDGYIAVEMPVKPDEWIPIEKVGDRSVRYYEPLIAQEAGGSILGDIPAKQYEVKDYSEFSHLIDVHSWDPFIDPFAKGASLTLNSQNLLGTCGASLGYEYNWNEKTSNVSLGASYAGWYPILDAAVRYGGRASTYSDASGNTVIYSWRETSLAGGISLPLNLTKGLYATRLLLGTSMRYTKISNLARLEAYSNNNGTFLPVRYALSFARGYAWVKDINPVWGQFIDLSYSHTPFKGDYRGSLVSVRGTFYIPGLFRHHSFFLDLGYEKQKPDNYRFESEMLFARGYSSEFNEDLYKVGMSYALPLFYPDAGIPHVVYFKRIASNFFYDHSEGKYKRHRDLYRSAGVDLFSDLNIFAFDAMTFRIGVRYSYQVDQKSSAFSLLLGAF